MCLLPALMYHNQSILHRGARHAMSTRPISVPQEKLKSRRNCPYCNGSGKLVCALCCSAGTFTTKLPGSDVYSVLPCPGCSGKGTINCLNCRLVLRSGRANFIISSVRFAPRVSSAHIVEILPLLSLFFCGLDRVFRGKPIFQNPASLEL